MIWNYFIILLSSFAFTCEAIEINDTTLTKSHFDVYLYNTKNGTDEYKLLRVSTGGVCTKVPENWQNLVSAVGIEKYCLRFWKDDNCNGDITRCYCDTRYLSLDADFRISRNESWNRQVKGLSTCITATDTKDISLAWLFSMENFKGNLTTIVLRNAGECLSFPEQDKWHGYGKSSWLFHGCVEYYEQENCIGNKSLILSKRQHHLNKIPNNSVRSIKSVRNCNADETVINEHLKIEEDNSKHGVGVYIYPKGFSNGYPWNKS